MTGERLVLVKLLLRRRASTRIWKRVATGEPVLSLRRNVASVIGSVTTIFFEVAVSAFTKKARLLLARKMTVFFLLPETKLRARDGELLADMELQGLDRLDHGDLRRCRGRARKGGE